MEGPILVSVSMPIYSRPLPVRPVMNGRLSRCEEHMRDSITGQQRTSEANKQWINNRTTATILTHLRRKPHAKPFHHARQQWDVNHQNYLQQRSLRVRRSHLYIECHGHGRSATYEGVVKERIGARLSQKSTQKNSTVRVRHSRKNYKVRSQKMRHFYSRQTRRGKKRRDVMWPYTWSDFLSGRTYKTLHLYRLRGYRGLSPAQLSYRKRIDPNPPCLQCSYGRNLGPVWPSQLDCLIEGEFIVFLVMVERDCPVVGDLKEIV